MITLSQLCCPSAKPGTLEGYCILCGLHTDQGHPIPKRGNFTGWSYCAAGNVVCPSCLAFWSEPKFRNRSWVATQQGVEFLKIKEAAPRVLDPPEPPFFIYLTKGGQRQGWLSAMRLVAWSRERFFVATDWLDAPVPILLSAARELAELVRELKARKVGISELQSVEFKMKTWQRAEKEGWTKILRLARLQAGNPMWEVVLHAA